MLEECLKSRIAIFGGDVVKFNNNGYFEYNYYNKKEAENEADYMLRSIKKLLYIIMNKMMFIFVLHSI